MPAKRSASKPTKSPVRAQKTQKNGAPDRLNQLERLIELMVEKDVVEVELEEGGSRWRVRRKEPHAAAMATQATMAMPAMGMPTMGMPMMGQHQAPAGPASPVEPQGEVFKSPMLGTFYRAASPESESFCKPGDRVSSDRTLCIIEAMKVMNEIKAEREFEIVDVLVKNGEPVEFGQPLFLIR